MQRQAVSHPEVPLPIGLLPIVPEERAGCEPRAAQHHHATAPERVSNEGCSFCFSLHGHGAEHVQALRSRVNGPRTAGVLARHVLSACHIDAPAVFALQSIFDGPQRRGKEIADSTGLEALQEHVVRRFVVCSGPRDEIVAENRVETHSDAGRDENGEARDSAAGRVQAAPVALLAKDPASEVDDALLASFGRG